METPRFLNLPNSQSRECVFSFQSEIRSIYEFLVKVMRIQWRFDPNNLEIKLKRTGVNEQKTDYITDLLQVEKTEKPFWKK